MKVVVLGASPSPERYAYMAWKLLEEFKHEVTLVNPLYQEIEGKVCFPNLSNLKDIDTVTLYVTPKHLKPHMNELIRLKPRRVIANPGTFDAELMGQLKQAGIMVDDACTLVLLRTGQF